jgi:hypothetical protein
VLRETHLEEMRIEQNTISRDWTVWRKGRRFFVNFTESDGQTLALCNRDNWQIDEETEDSIKELNAYVCPDGRPEEREEAQENAEMIDKLIGFCIRKWDNAFMQGMKENLEEQKRRLEG